jgi:hypothetical protein
MNRAELREQILRHADMVGSLFVSDVELNALIDLTTRQLYDVLVAQYGDEYFCTTQWFGVNSGVPPLGPLVAWPNTTFGTGLTRGATQEVSQNIAAPDFLLPENGSKSSFLIASDFMRLLRAEFVAGTVTQNAMDVYTGIPPTGAETRYEPQYVINTTDQYSRPMSRIDTVGADMLLRNQDWEQGDVRYRLRYGTTRVISRVSVMGPWQETVVDGNVIDFLPVTNGKYAVCLTYVPKPRLLIDDTKDFAYPFPEFIVHGCAAYCLEKERSDSSVQRQLQAAVRESIVQESRTTDAANPPMVVMKNRRRRAYGEPFQW